MTQQPVSVIIPTYNRARYLPHSIAAILAGSAVPEEIIVVDDGSDDDTASVVRGFASRVRYVRQSNGGKSVALNRGMSMVTQPYVWIMDDDDLARPRGLEHLYDALADRPASGFAYGWFTVFKHDDTTDEGREPLRPRSDAESFHLGQLEGCSVLQPAMLVRRDSYRMVGSFDPALPRSQDYDMLLRLSRLFEPIEVSETIFDQRQHDGARGTESLQRRRQSSDQLWRRYNAAILARVYTDYALPEYLPPGQGDDDNHRHRALVRRAALMGRHGLWQLGLDDLKEAARCAQQELKPADVDLFRRSLAHFPPGAPAAPLRKVHSLVQGMSPASRAPLLDAVRSCRSAIWREKVARALDRVPGASASVRRTVAAFR